MEWKASRHAQTRSPPLAAGWSFPPPTRQPRRPRPISTTSLALVTVFDSGLANSAAARLSSRGLEAGVTTPLTSGRWLPREASQSLPRKKDGVCSGSCYGFEFPGRADRDAAVAAMKVRDQWSRAVRPRLSCPAGAPDCLLFAAAVIPPAPRWRAPLRGP